MSLFNGMIFWCIFIKFINSFFLFAKIYMSMNWYVLCHWMFLNALLSISKSAVCHCMIVDIVFIKIHDYLQLSDMPFNDVILIAVNRQTANNYNLALYWDCVMVLCTFKRQNDVGELNNSALLIQWNSYSEKHMLSMDRRRRSHD